MSDMKQEKLIDDQPIPVPVEGIKKILFQMENCICIIYQEDGGKGTGFFCNISYQNNDLPVLITNNHILNENDIENGKIIKLMINNKVKKIEIDDSRIKYTNLGENIDITIIEIKPNKDGIELNKFLELDKKDLNKNKENIELEYKKKSIYIIHYPKGKLNVSYGLINDIINNKKINHKCNTEDGSSGSPILSLETFKVIGIHCGGYPDKIKLNYGTFIKYAIDIFNNFKSTKNEINKKKNENTKNKKNEKNLILKTKSDIFVQTASKPFYSPNRQYKITTEPNLRRMTGKNNLKEYNPKLSKINTTNYYFNNKMRTKETTPLKANNNYQYIVKKSESINKSYENSAKNPNKKKNIETEEFPNSLNKKEGMDFDDKERNEVFDNKKISSKSKCINDTKMNFNLNIVKEKNENNILTDSNNLKSQNQIIKLKVSLSSDKTEKIDENKKNNITINQDFKNEIINKLNPEKEKEKIKNNKYIKNDKKSNENESEDRNIKNKSNKFSMPSIYKEDTANNNYDGKESKYKKIYEKTNNQTRLIYKKI